MGKYNSVRSTCQVKINSTDINTPDDNWDCDQYPHCESNCWQKRNKPEICLLYIISDIAVLLKNMIKMKQNILKTWYQDIDRLHPLKLFFYLERCIITWRRFFQRFVEWQSAGNLTKLKETRLIIYMIDIINVLLVVICKIHVPLLLTDGHRYPPWHLLFFLPYYYTTYSLYCCI